MKQIIISEEEARTIVMLLKNNWIPLDIQRFTYDLITRLERELGIE